MLYSEVFVSVSVAGAAGLCSCFRRVHLLSRVAWQEKRAGRTSSCATALAGELFFAKLYIGSSGRQLQRYS